MFTAAVSFIISLFNRLRFVIKMYYVDDATDHYRYK